MLLLENQMNRRSHSLWHPSRSFDRLSSQICQTCDDGSTPSGTLEGAHFPSGQRLRYLEERVKRVFLGLRALQTIRDSCP